MFMMLGEIVQDTRCEGVGIGGDRAAGVDICMMGC